MYNLLCFTFFEDKPKAQRFFQPIITNLNKLQIRGLFINGVH